MSVRPRFQLLTLALAITATVPGRAPAQFGRSYAVQTPLVQHIPYDGRFTFARLSFVTGPGGYYYRGLPAWAHGYNEAERNLVQILNALSTTQPRMDATVVFNLDDPELFKYPLAYMAEADFWTLSDKEALAFRKYLLKGGFVIFDDFRDPYRMGGTGWEGFVENMKRILPEARIVDLTPRDPIFHSFYEINSFGIIPQAYDQGHAVLRGIYQDNDPTKRLIAMINFNTDVSDFWEFSGVGRYQVSQDNEAYKLGVNYLIYAMSH